MSVKITAPFFGEIHSLRTILFGFLELLNLITRNIYLNRCHHFFLKIIPPRYFPFQMMYHYPSYPQSCQFLQRSLPTSLISPFSSSYSQGSANLQRISKEGINRENRVNTVVVRTENAQRAVTPGQIIALYRGEECLGGAVVGPHLNELIHTRIETNHI